MNTFHFDVDSELHNYLSGEKFNYSLQDIDNTSDFGKVEAVTIKTASVVNADTLKHFPQLKLLVTRTVGTDHIDLDYCKKNDIEVKNIPDYGAFNIAEHTFALILAGARNIIKTNTQTQSGTFSYKNNLAFALEGKTLGVFGTGKIGLEVIKRANGFGMKVVAYDVYKNEKAAEELGFEYVDLDTLLSESDVITLHAPLLDTTHHIIDSTAIAKMKEGIILVNTARGELIDTNALLKKLNKFRFVGLDVLEGEKEFGKNHSLLGYEHVVITPHVAFYSDKSVKKIAEETERIVKEFSP